MCKGMEKMNKKRIAAVFLTFSLLFLSACERSAPEEAETTEHTVTSSVAEATQAYVTVTESITETTVETEPVTEPVTEETTAEQTEPVTEPSTESETEAETETTTKRSVISQIISTIHSTTKPTTAPPPPTTKSMRVSGYTSEQVIDYFLLTALNAENGVSLGRVIKWTDKITVSVTGNYLDKDVELIKKLCAAFNKTDGFPGATVVTDSANADVIMMFAGSAELSRHIENYSILDDGYCGMIPDVSFRLKKAVIGINSGMLNRKKRDSVICEELMQAMGLPNDSTAYKESIFYQKSDSRAWPSAIDWGVFTILYNPGIEPGMNKKEARATARTFVLNGR